MSNSTSPLHLSLMDVDLNVLLKMLIPIILFSATPCWCRETWVFLEQNAWPNYYQTSLFLLWFFGRFSPTDYDISSNKLLNSTRPTLKAVHKYFLVFIPLFVCLVCVWVCLIFILAATFSIYLSFDSTYIYFWNK